MKASTDRIVITCEHGGNRVPSGYRQLFTGNFSVLNTHRGWDAGALDLAKALARTLKAPLISSEITRLLVDMNRSLHHSHVFSEFSRKCNTQTKNIILQKYYFPYRKKVEMEIRNLLSKDVPVIHFSIHSFTPVLDGTARNADIGLLYDPKRKRERSICKELKFNLQNMQNNHVIRCNYPYHGNADGLTTALRKQYNDKQYAGIEIEINQKHVKDKKHWEVFKKMTIASIRQFIHGEYVCTD